MHFYLYISINNVLYLILALRLRNSTQAEHCFSLLAVIVNELFIVKFDLRLYYYTEIT